MKRFALIGLLGFNAACGFVGGAAKIGDDMLPDEE